MFVERFCQVLIDIFPGASVTIEVNRELRVFYLELILELLAEFDFLFAHPFALSEVHVVEAAVSSFGVVVVGEVASRHYFRDLACSSASEGLPGDQFVVGAVDFVEIWEFVVASCMGLQFAVYQVGFTRLHLIKIGEKLAR